jgi:ADP-ribose pyrophosphatase
MNIVQNKLLLHTKYLNFNETIYKDTKDNLRNWCWVERPNKRKAVMIVAEVLGDWKWFGIGYKQNSRLVIIKEFRVPISGYEWGFPAGLVDGDEPVETTVIRELKEETNLDLVSIDEISPFVYNTAGISNESISIVYATVEGELSKKNLESSEDIETFLMTQEEVKKLLEDKDKLFGAKAWIIMNTYAKFGRII